MTQGGFALRDAAGAVTKLLIAGCILRIQPGYRKYQTLNREDSYVHTSGLSSKNFYRPSR